MLVPSLPFPSPPCLKASARVCVVREECGHHFGLFWDAAGVSVAGISPFAIDHAVPQYLPCLHCIECSEVVILLLNSHFVYEAVNCDLWVQLDNYVSFMEEKVYVCITSTGKTVVTIYFSCVAMRSSPYETKGMWITCSTPPMCWGLCLLVVSSLCLDVDRDCL